MARVILFFIHGALNFWCDVYFQLAKFITSFENIMS